MKVTPFWEMLSNFLSQYELVAEVGMHARIPCVVVISFCPLLCWLQAKLWIQNRFRRWTGSLPRTGMNRSGTCNRFARRQTGPRLLLVTATWCSLVQVDDQE